MKYPRTVCVSLVGSAASFAPTGQCASRLVIVKSKHTPLLGRIQAGKVRRMSRTAFVGFFDIFAGWKEMAVEEQFVL